jgi:hypothetical protein
VAHPAFWSAGVNNSQSERGRLIPIKGGRSLSPEYTAPFPHVPLREKPWILRNAASEK